MIQLDPPASEVLYERSLRLEPMRSKSAPATDSASNSMPSSPHTPSSSRKSSSVPPIQLTGSSESSPSEDSVMLQTQIEQLQREMGLLKGIVMMEQFEADTSSIREQAVSAKRAVSAMVYAHEQTINALIAQHQREMADLLVRNEELLQENAILKESLAMLATRKYSSASTDGFE